MGTLKRHHRSRTEMLSDQSDFYHYCNVTEPSLSMTMKQGCFVTAKSRHGHVSPRVATGYRTLFSGSGNTTSFLIETSLQYNARNRWTFVIAKRRLKVWVKRENVIICRINKLLLYYYFSLENAERMIKRQRRWQATPLRGSYWPDIFRIIQNLF